MPAWDWQTWTAAVATPIVVLVGVALTALQLPGAWLLVAWTLGVKLWQPDLFSWWVLVGVVLLAASGEVLEFVASALGASKAGASRKAALASIAGSFLGALLGLPFLPPLGPIVGGVLGAGVTAILVERWVSKKAWGDSARVGGGAALGRLIATVGKTVVTMGIGLALVVAVLM